MKAVQNAASICGREGEKLKVFAPRMDESLHCIQFNGICLFRETHLANRCFGTAVVLTFTMIKLNHKIIQLLPRGAEHVGGHPGGASERSDRSEVCARFVLLLGRCAGQTSETVASFFFRLFLKHYMRYGVKAKSTTLFSMNCDCFKCMRQINNTIVCITGQRCAGAAKVA